MDTAQKQTQSTTYRETFRRHWMPLSLPLVLGILAAAVLIFTHATTYKSTASLWVDTAPPTASSIGPGAASLPTTPAAAEQSVLGELLTTNQFAVAVANESLLGRQIGDRSEIQAKAASYLSASQVGSLVAGPQVLSLSYSASSPAIAQSTLGAIIRELISDSNGLGAAHAQASLSYYKALQAEQGKNLTVARESVDEYLVHHPNATVQSDPNLSALMAAENAANQQLAQTSGALSELQGSAADATGWMVRVVDAPGPGQRSTLGKKKMLEVLLGGLFGGGLIAFLGVIALVPARPEERLEDELLTAGLIGRRWLEDPTESSLAPTATRDAREARSELAEEARAHSSSR